MENLKLWLLLVLLTTFGCGQRVGNKDSPADGQPLTSSEVAQVKIGEDNAGVLNITYQPIATLETELKTYWGLSSLANLRIENEGGKIWLKGDGNLPSGEHVDWAFILENQSDDLYLIVNGGSQSCTARECCSGCKLLIASDVEGSCDCTAINMTFGCVGPDNENKKTCGHSVTSGLSTDQAYTEMLNRLLG